MQNILNRPKIASLVFGLFIIGCAFYQPTWLQDYFTNSGWLALSLLSLFLFLLIAGADQLVLPSNAGLWRIVFVVSLLVVSSLINHATFFEERWLHRYILFGFVFVALQAAQHIENFEAAVMLPLALFVTAVAGESIYQYFFVCVPNDPLETSCAASRFWNINMLSQSLVLALPILHYLQIGALRHLRVCAWLAMGLATGAILLSGCRSSLVAFAVFVGLRVWEAKRIRFAFAIFVLVVGLYGSVMHFFQERTLSPVSVGKVGSARYRLMIWEDTLGMIRANPFGVGVNNFEFGFLPYKRVIPGRSFTGVVDKNPHNEVLRIFAEEGWLVGVSLLGIALFFCFRAIQNALSGTIGIGQEILLVVVPEALFQFPLEMYFPIFLLVLGISFQKTGVRLVPFKFYQKLLFGCFLLIATCLFTIRNTTTINPIYAEGYCKYFLDNWRMCGDFFKHFYEAREDQTAANVIRPVIRRQPSNFIALHFDYLVAREDQKQLLACNYVGIVKGQATLAPDVAPSCAIVAEPSDLVKKLNDYARSR